MPTIRQIVDYLIDARPNRCWPQLLLSAKYPNRAINNSNLDTSMIVTSNNDNNKSENQQFDRSYISNYAII